MIGGIYLPALAFPGEPVGGFVPQPADKGRDMARNIRLRTLHKVIGECRRLGMIQRTHETALPQLVIDERGAAQCHAKTVDCCLEHERPGAEAQALQMLDLQARTFAPVMPVAAAAVMLAGRVM